MNKLLFGLIAGLLMGFTVSAAAAETADLKYGLYIHYGMDTFSHAGEKGRLPVERFAPTSVNVKSWARAAAQAGMSFAVLTAKHESGFCLWASKAGDYDIAHSPFQGDLMADFIAACKAEGIVPGVHYSIPDACNEGAVRFQGDVPPAYFDVIKQHVTELNTQYPELRVFILDISSRLSPAQLDELSQIVKRLNPQCAVWTTERGGMSGGPNHVAATVNKSWMWSLKSPLNPAPQLFHAYQQSQSAGKAFLLNVGPLPSGTIPDDQLAVLKQMKNLIANPPSPVVPVVAAPAAAAPDAKPDAAERLKKIKSLYEQGLINKEDYEKKVKEIMDAL